MPVDKEETPLREVMPRSLPTGETDARRIQFKNAKVLYLVLEASECLSWEKETALPRPTATPRSNGVSSIASPGTFCPH